MREDGASVDASGENLMLKPDAVQNLGFALFELGTNAVKYGALAAPAGKITIRWELVDADGRKHVRFTWQETGGPPVTQPRRKGFGAMVIERFVSVTFGGHVEPVPARRLLLDAGNAGREPAERDAGAAAIAAGGGAVSALAAGDHIAASQDYPARELYELDVRS